MTHDFTDFGRVLGHNAGPSVTAKTDGAPQIVTWIAHTLELGSLMVSNSRRRRRRGGWRFFLGISVVGALIFASASHAAAGCSRGVRQSSVADICLPQGSF
jgi:hypothetical protein